MSSITDSRPQVINLSPEEFIQLPNQPRLIDVRSSFEYKMFHAPNAVNLSLTRILIGSNSWFRRWVIPKWFQELPTDESLAFICLTAHRSPMAAEQIIKAGFTEVYNITGGMMEWRRLKLPTCKN